MKYRDDLEWLDKIAARNKAAIELLFFRFERQMKHAALKRLHPLPGKEKEEIVNDGFMEALEALYLQAVRGTIARENFNMGAYLYKIFYNKVYSILRKNPQNEILIEETIEDPDPWHAHFLISERAQTIKSKIVQLGEECRKLLDFIYFQNFECRALAESLEMNEDTLKYKLYACVKKLKKMIGLQDDL